MSASQPPASAEVVEVEGIKVGKPVYVRNKLYLTRKDVDEIVKSIRAKNTDLPKQDGVRFDVATGKIIVKKNHNEIQISLDKFADANIFESWPSAPLIRNAGEDLNSESYLKKNINQMNRIHVFRGDSTSYSMDIVKHRVKPVDGSAGVEKLIYKVEEKQYIQNPTQIPIMESFTLTENETTGKGQGYPKLYVDNLPKGLKNLGVESVKNLIEGQLSPKTFVPQTGADGKRAAAVYRIMGKVELSAWTGLKEVTYSLKSKDGHIVVRSGKMALEVRPQKEKYQPQVPTETISLDDKDELTQAFLKEKIKFKSKGSPKDKTFGAKLMDLPAGATFEFTVPQNVVPGTEITVPVKVVYADDKFDENGDAQAAGGKSSTDITVKIRIKTWAEKITPTVPEKTKVDSTTTVKDDEQGKIKKAIEGANKTKFPENTTVTVDGTGKATIKYPDNSEDTIEADQLIQEKETPTVTPVRKYNGDWELEVTYSNGTHYPVGSTIAIALDGGKTLNPRVVQQGKAKISNSQLPEAAQGNKSFTILDGTVPSKSVPIDVPAKQADPTVATIVVEKGTQTVDAKQGIASTSPNSDKIKTVAFKTVVDTSKTGEQKVQATITYEDDSTTEVNIPVKVQDTTKPAAPTVVAEQDGSVKITPPTDVDAKTVDISYKDNEGTSKTITVTKNEQGEWTVPAGSDATVENGVVILPEDKVQDNSVVSATAKDDANNESTPATATALAKPDTTPPAAPTVVAEKDGSIKITPPADPDAKTVEISYKDNEGTSKTITVTKNEQGEWTVPAGSDVTVKNGVVILPEDKVQDNSVVSATAKDDANNESTPATATALAKPDTTPPAAPTVVAEQDGSVKITPPTDVDAKTVQISYTDNSGATKTIVVTKDNQGMWQLPPDTDATIEGGVIILPEDKVKDDTEVVATAKDGSGNESAIGSAKAVAKPKDPSRPNPNNPGKPKPNPNDPAKPNPNVPQKPKKPEENSGYITVVPVDPKTTQWDRQTSVKDQVYYEKAYMQGYGKGNFGPKKTLTRAEAAQILANALISDGYSKKVPVHYKDLKENGWYLEAIKTVRAAGVFEGYDDGSFKPERAITRAEWIATLCRFQDLKKASGNSFGLKASHWALGEIEAAKHAGWLGIYPSTLDADGFILREEVAAITNKAFNKLVDKTYLRAAAETLVHFSDVRSDSPYYEDILAAANTLFRQEDKAYIGYKVNGQYSKNIDPKDAKYLYFQKNPR